MRHLNQPAWMLVQLVAIAALTWAGSLEYADQHEKAPPIVMMLFISIIVVAFATAALTKGWDLATRRIAVLVARRRAGREATGKQGRVGAPLGRFRERP